MSLKSLAFGAFAAAIFGSAAANPLLNARAACNADNCARQVTGTSILKNQPPIATRLADCNSFFTTTVTPAPVISTVTQFSNSNAPSQPSLVTTAVTVTQTAVPTYITSCGASPTIVSRYSSACACFSGVTKTVTTVAQPTYTTTAYVAMSTFALQITSGDLAGEYIGSDEAYVSYVTEGDTAATAQGLQFQPDGSIIYVGSTNSRAGQTVRTADFYSFSGGTYNVANIWVNDQGFSSYPPIMCTVATGGAFTCTYQGGTGLFFFCDESFGARNMVIATDVSQVQAIASENQFSCTSNSYTLAAVPYPGS